MVPSARALLLLVPLLLLLATTPGRGEARATNAHQQQPHLALKTDDARFQRLGAFDFDPGESSPVVYGGKPLLLESTSGCYPSSARWSVPEFKYCPSYLRLVDLTTGAVVANITGSCNHTFGSALVVPATGSEPETMFVFASRWARFQAPHPWCPSPKGQAAPWGGSCKEPTKCAVDVFSSSDKSLQAWRSSVALGPAELGNVSSYNTDVVKVGTGAVR